MKTFCSLRKCSYLSPLLNTTFKDIGLINDIVFIVLKLEQEDFNITLLFFL